MTKDNNDEDLPIPEPPEGGFGDDPWFELDDSGDQERLEFLDAIDISPAWFPSFIEEPPDDVDVTSEAKNHEKEVLRRAKLENDEYEAANKHRKIFLWFAVAVTSVPVVAASAGFMWMVVTREMTDGMAIAFFASVVVEVIGLVLVLANYLFPKGGGTPGLTNGDKPKD